MSAKSDEESENAPRHLIEPLLASGEANAGDGVQQDDHEEGGGGVIGGPLTNQRPPERKISRGERKISRKSKTVMLISCMRVTQPPTSGKIREENL